METYRVKPQMGNNVLKIQDRMIDGGDWVIPAKKVFIIHTFSKVEEGVIAHILVINNIEIEFSDDEFEIMLKAKTRIQNVVTSLQS